jgi:transaldolase
MNPAQNLINLGQSVWYDNISRDFIVRGEIARLVQEWGVRGMTSNPTIFDGALKKGSAYDGQVTSLVNKGLSTDQLFFELALEDIAWAADILLPIYKESNGTDGFVSLEVSPLLARDAKGTVVQAKELFSRLNRSNVMIKIPGTKECLPAIHECLKEGIHINVTLLFSVDAYVDVAKTYCAALTERMKMGKPIDKIRSVASFFVSRVDTIVDTALDKIGTPEAAELKSKFGIANCKLAYEQFEKIFNGSEFADLKANGAAVQRPLWASTGVKNPALPDTTYVDELVGPDTVNTMPHNTLEALVKHGGREAKLVKGLDDAKKVKESLIALGVDLEVLMEELLVDGLKKFSESFESLITTVENKVKACS